MRSHLLPKIGVISAMTLIPVGSQAITFNLNDITPGGMNAAALQAFQDATAIWEGLIINDIEVNLDIRFDDNDINGNPFGTSVLASTSRSLVTPSYTAVRGALIAETTPSANDFTAIANLPSGPSLSFRTNVTGSTNNGNVIIDNDASNNNNFLDVNTANAKALGLINANSPGNDAGIAFNSSFYWDYDQSDGVGAGLQDFVGVTVHEIGHALGFRSGVDSVDASHGAGPFTPQDLDAFAVVTVADLFRYNAPGQLDLAAGGAPYYSLDGGTTNIALFSTGSFNGDGRQASHWKDNLGLGIFDPTANPPGQINVLSQLDLDAIDVIGYDLNLIPEPSTTLLTLVTLGFAARRRKR